MCGIAGFVGPPDRALLDAMTALIVHRGPDDEGVLETPAVSLGHRRLSIIDIAHGQQPMADETGRLRLIYNGELYNYRELRAELEHAGATFRTASDTEVFLAAYAAWGTACFERANGMWALAILDERGDEPVLVLARDHFGIKPLYLAETGGRLLFASEIKALLADPTLVARADEGRLVEYLLRGLHDHDERTFFEDVRQVAPGTAVTVTVGADGTRGVVVTRYYDPVLSEDDSSGGTAAFRDGFRRAVERRLVAEVPVGTCLSGGLDSSSIVMVMSELLADRVPDAASMGERLKTFSAVFDGDPIDEQRYIEPVLARSGAERNFVRPLPGELFADLPRFVWHQDEPIVSSGPYAQWRVMALAQGKAKVLLDGQAGDELLAGYVPYQVVYLRQLARQRRWALLGREAAAARDVILPLARAKLHNRRRALDPASVLGHRLARPELATAARAADRRSQDDLKVRLLQDLTTYSLPSLLRYEDRNSMAFSIESRIPFLDQELVSTVCVLPADVIVRDGWSRWILREALADSLPPIVARRRKKVGFTTPETTWLRAERAAVQGLYRSPGLARSGLVDVPALVAAFTKSCDGLVEPSPMFWRALNLEVWRRVFLRPGSRPFGPPERDLWRLGDEEAAALAGTETAKRLLEVGRPHPGKHLFLSGPDAVSIHARVPLRTALVVSGDDLVEVLSDAVASGGRVGDSGGVTGGVDLEAGDVLCVSEKIVAISEGRSFPVRTITARPLARVLSRRVGRTPAGIGLGIPETMELAIKEAGAARIVAAAVIGAATRVFGRRGDFYRVAGHGVNAIDGPTAGTIAPYDGHAKLPPAAPEGTAKALAGSLSERFGCSVGVAVVDANDRGVQVLGASAGVDRVLVRWLFADNPLGQRAEQTPLALLRRVDDGAPGAHR